MKYFVQSLRWWMPGALLLLLALTILAACDGTSEPELIATYPRSGPPGGERPLPQPPSNPPLVEPVEAVELATRQIARFAGTLRGAADQVRREAADLALYLVSVLIWLVAVAGPFLLQAVGALTVLRWLVQRLPDERTVRKGDRGR